MEMNNLLSFTKDIPIKHEGAYLRLLHSIGLVPHKQTPLVQYEEITFIRKLKLLFPNLYRSLAIDEVGFLND